MDPNVGWCKQTSNAHGMNNVLTFLSLWQTHRFRTSPQPFQQQQLKEDQKLTKKEP